MNENRFETLVTKRALTEDTNKRLRRAVFWLHTRNIVAILLDEITKDLFAGKVLRIFNFGNLELRPAKPRKYHDFRFKKIMESPGKRTMKFSITRRISEKICSFIDIEKTFGKD